MMHRHSYTMVPLEVVRSMYLALSIEDARFELLELAHNLFAAHGGLASMLNHLRHAFVRAVSDGCPAAPR